MTCGSSVAPLNFAPTTSLPERKSVHLGDVPASRQALCCPGSPGVRPLQLSNSAAGEAVRVTSAKAPNSAEQVPPVGTQLILPSELVIASRLGEGPNTGT